MIIMDTETIPKCFDGGSIVDYKFNSVVTKDSIYKMASLGKLDYYKTFPTPYFTIHLKNGGQIRGIEGRSTLRVVYEGSSKWSCKELVERFMQSF
jgi:hypothetical protein